MFYAIQIHIIFRSANGKKITADGDEPFIHVDAKVNLDTFKKNIEPSEKVHILSNRISVIGAGMAAVKADPESFNGLALDDLAKG